MNISHLQETAKHYANLAEQYRTELAEEQELNEDLLGLVEALCEELGIDVEKLLNEMRAVTDAELRNPEHRARIAHQAERMRKIILAFNAGEGSEKKDDVQRNIDAGRIATMAGALGMKVRAGGTGPLQPKIITRSDIRDRQGHPTDGQVVTDKTPLSVGGDGENIRKEIGQTSIHMRRLSQDRRDRQKALGRHNDEIAAANKKWGVDPSTSNISMPDSPDIPSHLINDHEWQAHQRRLRNNPATRKTSSRPRAGDDRTY